MSEKQITPSEKRSHASSNDWNLLPGGGTDTISFTVPSGERFTRYSIDLLTPSLTSGYEVVSAPKRGATGQQKMRIKYHYAPFNKVSYRVRLYYGKPGPVEIAVDSTDWLNRVKDAIAQKLEVRLAVHGAQARELYRQLLLLAPHDVIVPADLFYEPDESDNEPDNDVAIDQPQDGQQPIATLSEPVAVTITLGVLGALVIIAGFATIASVLMMAMHRGYAIDNAEFTADTPAGGASIIIGMKPQSNT